MSFKHELARCKWAFVLLWAHGDRPQWLSPADDRYLGEQLFALARERLAPKRYRKAARKVISGRYT